GLRSRTARSAPAERALLGGVFRSDRGGLDGQPSPLLSQADEHAHATRSRLAAGRSLMEMTECGNRSRDSHIPTGSMRYPHLQAITKKFYLCRRAVLLPMSPAGHGGRGVTPASDGGGISRTEALADHGGKAEAALGGHDLREVLGRQAPH